MDGDRRIELLEARVELLSDVLRELVAAISRIDDAQGKRLTAIAIDGLLAESKKLAEEARALPAPDAHESQPERERG